MDNGMCIRLYNPGIVLSIFRYFFSCSLATLSNHEFLWNSDPLLIEKPEHGLFSNSCIMFLQHASTSEDQVGCKEERPESHRKHSTDQEYNRNTIYYLYS